MKIKNTIENKIASSLHIGFLLSLAGGFQDAYSYHCRNKVFANAQTGNIVLLGGHLISGEFSMALRYFFPIIAFISGIYIAEWLKYFFKKDHKIHSEQIILSMQILLILVVGFMPESMSTLANIFLSFACAIQLGSFKKFRGVSFATTMCIGNMRSATEFLANYHITKNKNLKSKSYYYYSAIFIFSIGASLGFVASKYFYFKSIWISTIPLVLALILVTAERKNENSDSLKKEKHNIVSDFKEEIKYIKELLKKR